MKLLRSTYLVIIYAYLLLPILAVIIISFSNSRYLEFPPETFSLKWYVAIFEEKKWLSSIFYSCKIALATAFFSTTLSMMSVLSFSSYRRIFTYFFLRISLIIMMIPGIILGVVLFFWFNTLQIHSATVAIVIAHTIISAPIAVWILNDANNAISENIDNTALTLGSNNFHGFLYARLPLLRYSIAISFITTFIISFDEPVITLYLSDANNVTLPKAMWDSIRYEINPTLVAVSSLIIIFTLLLTIPIYILNKKNYKDENR